MEYSYHLALLKANNREMTCPVNMPSFEKVNLVSSTANGTCFNPEAQHTDCEGATSLCYQQLASPLVLYCGFDDPRSMGRYETGSRAASPIWVSYMRSVLSRYSRRGFRKPEGVVMADIAARNGKLAGSDTEKSYLLPFRKGNVPDRVDTGERKDRQMLQEIF